VKIHQGRNPPKGNDKSRKSAKNLADSLEISAPQSNSLDGHAHSGIPNFSFFSGKNFFKIRIFVKIDFKFAANPLEIRGAGCACDACDEGDEGDEGDSFCSHFP